MSNILSINLCGDTIMICLEGHKDYIVAEIGDYRTRQELMKEIEKTLEKYGLIEIKDEKDTDFG